MSLKELLTLEDFKLKSKAEHQSLLLNWSCSQATTTPDPGIQVLSLTLFQEEQEVDSLMTSVPSPEDWNRPLEELIQ